MSAGRGSVPLGAGAARRILPRRMERFELRVRVRVMGVKI